MSERTFWENHIPGFIEDSNTAHTTIDSLSGQLTIEAVGLERGKGVIVTSTTQEAHQAITDLMERRAFGVAGSKVIISSRAEPQD